MENKIKSHLITLNNQRIEFVPFTEQRENSINELGLVKAPAKLLENNVLALIESFGEIVSVDDGLIENSLGLKYLSYHYDSTPQSYP